MANCSSSSRNGSSAFAKSHANVKKIETTKIVYGISYTIQNTDAEKTIICTNFLPITINIPPDLPIGFKCEIIQRNMGKITLKEGEGVVLNGEEEDFISQRHSSFYIFCTALNTYTVTKNLA